MLINGVDMNIKLTRTPEAFYSLAPNNDTKVRIKILDAKIALTPLRTLILLESKRNVID
jgi:hypothetical protein